MKDSVIISAFVKLWMFLKTAYENSIYFKIFNKIADFIGGIFSRSLLFHIFSRTKADASESVVAKIINGFLGFFHKIFHEKVRRISRESRKSVVVRNVGWLLNGWYAVSIRYYALTLMAFAGFRIIVKRLMSQMIGPYTLILVAVALIGLVIDVSPAGLYEGSAIRRLIGLCDLPERVVLKKRAKPHKAVTVALVIGSIAGVLTVVPLGWLAILAICGMMLLISKPVIGIAIIAAAFPVLPTMGVVALGGYLMVALFIKYLYGETSKVNIDTFDIAIFVMCGVLVYGVLNSYAPVGSAFPAAVYILFVASFYTIRRAAKEKDFLNTLLNLIVFVSLGVSLYGIYQKVTGQAATTWTDTEMFEDMGGRIYSTFGNPNVFGEYLLMVMPITFGLMLKSKSANRKIVYFVIFALQMFCMILTYSRGCWIGIVLAMGLMILYTSRKLTSLMVFALFLVPLFIPDTIMQRLMSIGNVTDTSTSYRVYIWQGTIRMLKDFWYSGVGIGEAAFGMVYPSYSLNAVSAPHAHNLYLHILSETGIIGITAVGALLVIFYKYLSSAAIENKGNKITAVSLGCAMIGYLAQGMFDNVWYNYRIYFFFFVVLALGAALKDVSAKEDAK